MPNNLITQDIQNNIVLNIVNNELDSTTDRLYASIQAAYEDIAKVLATVNIPLSSPDKGEDEGLDVFELSQFLSELDAKEKLFLYFEYQKEDSGFYTVFAEIVNQQDLEDLIDNYNSENQSLNEMIAPNKHPLIKALKDNNGGWGDPGEKIYNKLSTTPAEKKHLGYGAFGSAYHKENKNEVVKVYNDPGYHEFAKYARDHHHEDPHLPKIHSVQRIKGTQYGVVRMEKLNPIKKGIYDDPPDKKEDWMKTHQYDVGYGVKHHPTMSKTLDNIRNHLNSKGIEHGFDLHSGNVMKRDDGTPVLTDPIVSFENQNFSQFKGHHIKEMTVRDVSKKLHHHGYEHHRSSGGHDVWKHKSGKGKIIPVPRHKGDLPPGTTRSILKAANIAETVWEYYKTK